MVSERPPRTRRSRWRRRALIGTGTLLVLFGAVFGAVAFLLAGLARPMVKSRVQAVLRDSAGIELDYAEGEGSLFSGVHLRDVRVATPKALRGVSPDVLRVESIDVRWALSRLASGAPQVDEIAIHGVDVTVVIDEHGRTSFDFQPPGASPAPPPVADQPGKPLTQLIDDLLSLNPPLLRLRVDPIRAVLLRTDHGAVVDELRIDGLTVELTGEAVKGGSHMKLALGTPDRPLQLVIDRRAKTTGKAQATLALAAEVRPGQATASLDLRLGEQSLVPRLKIERLVSLDAAVTLDAKQHRLSATISRAELADGSVKLSAEVERPDAPPSELVVRRLDADLDAQRLLALVPPDLAPLLPKLEGGRVEVHAEGIAVGTVPRVLPGGSAKATGKLEKLHVALAGLEADVPKATLELSTGSDLLVNTTIGARIGELRWRGGGSRVTLADARVELSGTKLRLDPANPSGAVKLELELGKADLDGAGVSAGAEGLVVGVGADVVKQPPYAAVVTVDAARLHAAQGGRMLVDEPVHARVDLKKVEPDLARPPRSRGDARVELTLGTIQLHLDARKAADSVDYTLDASAPSLGPVARVVPRGSIEVAWGKTGLQLKSTGRVDGLFGALRLKQDTQLELQRPAARGPAGALAARALALVMKSSGGLHKHEGELTVSLAELVREGSALGDGKLTTRFDFDLANPVVHAQVNGSGSAAPGVDGKLDASFDRASKTVRFGVDLSLRRLDTLAPLLGGARATRGFQLAGLEIDTSAHGELTGVIEAIGASGAPKLAAHPDQTARGEAIVKLDVRKLDWRDGDRQVSTPSLHWNGKLGLEGAKKKLAADLAFDEIAIAIGPTKLGLTGVSDALTIELTGDPLRGELDLHDNMSIKGLRQQLVPAYRTAQIAVGVRAHRDTDGVVRLSELRLDNVGAGTHLALTGGVDLGEDRRSVSLKGTLSQDLGKLWTNKQQLVASGNVSTIVEVESGDMRVFRTKSSLRINNGAISLPQKKINLEKIEGEIPVVADILFSKGVKLLRNVEVNTYSELRFVDQHPLLSRRSYLSVARVDTPWASIAPLAANLVVDNNILSLSQLELGLRGGHVGGRAAVELQWKDDKPTVEKLQLNLRASGVRSTQGEPFDGNTAVTLAVRQRSVQGRAEILRIGRHHLLDLLDLVDPPRSDAAINRVRRALALGYPDGVRVTFNRGFASAKITMGGVAKLLSIDEIRGIPMGPIIDRVLEPFDDSEEE
jgi:translocation and assembly module TamB